MCGRPIELEHARESTEVVSDPGGTCTIPLRCCACSVPFKLHKCGSCGAWQPLQNMLGHLAHRFNTYESNCVQRICEEQTSLPSSDAPSKNKPLTCKVARVVDWLTAPSRDEIS